MNQTNQDPRPSVDLGALWRAIEQAGSIQAYVNQQLSARGYLIERRDTARMSAAELKRYKQQLKDEAVEKRRLKAEAWAAYKAAHIVHLGEGIFFNEENDFDRFDLREPEARAAENELPTLDKPAQLAEALGLSVSELRWLTFHREAAESIHYQRFTIPKRRGGEREIWAPMPKLKAAQRWVMREIVEHLPVHGAAHGFIAGRSILTNAQVHLNAEILVNFDLQDFFPTVTWRRVKGVFRKAGYREQVATLLALLCTEPPREVIEHEGKRYYIALGQRCLPQGAPTSPAITNALCLRLDRRLSGLARSLGWRYTRYADDLTFSLPASEAKPKAKKGKAKPTKAKPTKAKKAQGALTGEAALARLMGGVKAIVAAEGFALNPDKTAIKRPSGRQGVTGLVVNGDGSPRVPREVRRRLRAALHNLE
ncbi:reverse transcriptase family protein, partial [Myxococcota bacterium]|nr:reverse transcriptase family protein [Myxococcota bacterium]